MTRFLMISVLYRLFWACDENYFISSTLQENLVKTANIWNNHLKDTWHNIQFLLIQQFRLTPCKQIIIHDSHCECIAFYAHKCGMEHLSLPSKSFSSIQKGEENKPEATKCSASSHGSTGAGWATTKPGQPIPSQAGPAQPSIKHTSKCFSEGQSLPALESFKGCFPVRA